MHQQSACLGYRVALRAHSGLQVQELGQALHSQDRRARLGSFRQLATARVGHAVHGRLHWAKQLHQELSVRRLTGSSQGVTRQQPGVPRVAPAFKCALQTSNSPCHSALPPPSVLAGGAGFRAGLRAGQALGCVQRRCRAQRGVTARPTPLLRCHTVGHDKQCPAHRPACGHETVGSQQSDTTATAGARNAVPCLGRTWSMWPSRQSCARHSRLPSSSVRLPGAACTTRAPARSAAAPATSSRTGVRGQVRPPGRPVHSASSVSALLLAPTCRGRAGAAQAVRACLDCDEPLKAARDGARREHHVCGVHRHRQGRHCGASLLLPARQGPSALVSAPPRGAWRGMCLTASLGPQDLGVSSAGRMEGATARPGRRLAAAGVPARG